MNQNKRVPIMAHMIPFFPDENTSREVVDALVDSGITWLEIQFPFTDPTADGPVIEAACTRALKSGFSTDKGFAFVRSVADLCAQAGVEILVMTYASLVYARGVERFLIDAKAAGASGVIIPDLPVDRDEGLYGKARELGLKAIPVIIPTIKPERQAMVLQACGDYVYAALRTGITGSETVLEPALLAWLEGIRRAGKKVLGGFGIKTPDKAALLAPHVDGVIVGSALVAAIDQAAAASPAAGRPAAVYQAVKGLATALVGPA